MGVAKDYIKNRIKRAIIKKIMFPYGAIFLALVLLIASAFGGFFSSNDFTDYLSEEDNKALIEYIKEKTTFSSVDYYNLDRNHFLKSDHVVGFINFLIVNNEEEFDDLDEGKKVVDKIVDNMLKPELKYSNSTESQKRTYMKEEKSTDSDGNEIVTYKEVVEETSRDVKVLNSGKSIYSEVDYTYENEVIRTVLNEGVPNKEEIIEITKPKIASTNIKGKPYDVLREAMRKVDRNLTESDIEMFVELIISPNKVLNGQEDWLLGNLSGVPSEFIPHFEEASQIFNIPPWLLAAVGYCESNFNPNSVSYTGATGIMQIQKYDIATGKDLWAWLIDIGLGDIYRNCGYTFTDNEDMWSQFSTDPRAQIIAGAYEVRYYINYVLWRKNTVPKLDYNSNENMSLINWNAERNDTELKDVIRRSMACYNAGPGGFGITNLDTALAGYPNKVYNMAMNYRDSGLTVVGGDAGKVVEEAMKHLGTPYAWGGKEPGGFDCSGLFYYSYKTALGIDIGGSTHTQCMTGNFIGAGPVDESMLQPGDLLFRSPTSNANGAHVVMYIGNGQIIHAPQTGDVVKIITYENLKSWMRIDQIRRYV